MDAELRVCLENCDLSDAQINAIRDEGYLLLEDFALNTYQDITNFAKRVQALPVIAEACDLDRSILSS